MYSFILIIYLCIFIIFFNDKIDDFYKSIGNLKFYFGF